MQSSKLVGRSSFRIRCTVFNVSNLVIGCNDSKYWVLSLADKYTFTSSAHCLNSPSNQSRAHYSVCWIWFGKFFNVQTGMLFSGGSRVAIYCSVMCGTTTCILPFVPNIPLLVNDIIRIVGSRTIELRRCLMPYKQPITYHRNYHQRYLSSPPPLSLDTPWCSYLGSSL